MKPMPMPTRVRTLVAAIALQAAALACKDTEPEPVAPGEAEPRPKAGASLLPELQGAPPHASGRPCGALDCRRFADATAALGYVMGTGPEVLAVGEAHALAGAAGIPTATERFERELLPELARMGATELVVELLNPAQGCTEAVAEVRRKQEPVVERQDPGNQDRFVQLGHAARRLGVVPYILEPTCSEYQAVVAGGADGLVRMLELIAAKTEHKLLDFWGRRKQAAQVARPSSARDSSSNVLVLAYGGAMHNDVSVPAEKAAFSFGKSLVEKMGSKYVALDLIVPEYIQDTDVWKALPWHPHFDVKAPPPDVTLFRVDEHSFVLIFGAQR